MKTAISMPDETFARVTDTAARLGLSRSDLLTRAAVAYLDDLEAQGVTEQINRVLERLGPDAATDHDFVAAGRARLGEIDDDW